MTADPARLGAGASLFLEFVPAPTRRSLGDDLEVPLVSSALIAEHAPSLTGPCLEVTWPGTAALGGVLRAVRHKDGVMAVRLPEVLSEDPRARGHAVQAVVAVAEDAAFDRPLVIVGGVAGTAGEGAAERFSDELFAAVDVGITSVVLRPAALDDELLDALCELTEPLRELGIGIEADFGPDEGAAFLLAQLDELGLPLAAVRGAGEDDELGGGLLVVDPAAGDIPDLPVRVSLDPFVVKGLARALDDEAGRALLASARERGASSTLAESLPRLAQLDERGRARAEALVYAEVEAAAVALQAARVASDLYDALARELDIDVARPAE